MTVLIDGRDRPATVLDVNLALDAALLRVEDVEVQAFDLRKRPAEPKEPAFPFGYPASAAGTVIPKLIGTRGEVDLVEDSFRSPANPGVSIPVIRVRGASDFGGSGGALVDTEGRLLGLTIAVRFVRPDSRAVSHVFAVPADALSEMVDRFLAEPDYGPDPDGDLLTGPEDSDRFVADLPDLRIRFFDPEFGLKVDSSMTVEDFVIRSNDLVESQRATQEEGRKIESTTADYNVSFQGGLNLSVGPAAFKSHCFSRRCSCRYPL